MRVCQRAWSVSLVMVAMGLALACTPARAQRAVYLVRHAERESLIGNDNPGLTPAGVARAGELRALLGHARIGAIYTSQFRRTKETAEPLATALSLSPTAITDGDADKTIEHIRANHAREIVLVVGHSNTIDKLLARLTGGEAVVTIQDSEFDRVFVAVVTGTDQAGWSEFRYGTPSPTPAPGAVPGVSPPMIPPHP
jgi:broad specificity phosphatase PhoE